MTNNELEPLIKLIEDLTVPQETDTEMLGLNYTTLKHIEELSAAGRKKIALDILNELKAQGKDQKTQGLVTVSRIVKTTFKTSIEQARELDAVITEEKVNTDKLRELHKLGVDIPGKQESEEVRVKVGETK